MTNNYSKHSVTKSDDGTTTHESWCVSEEGESYSKVDNESAIFRVSNNSWIDSSVKIGSWKTRGFEVVSNEHRYNWDAEIVLPVRADPRSAGYDFHVPVDITIPAKEKLFLFSDVKSYMQPDEYLTLVPRSSAGIKLDIMFSNTIGIIDSSYYENSDNDGNIGFSFRNMGDKDVTIKAGERIGQGIFMKYLLADNDVTISQERVGGYGSSGK